MLELEIRWHGDEAHSVARAGSRAGFSYGHVARNAGFIAAAARNDLGRLILVLTLALVVTRLVPGLAGPGWIGSLLRTLLSAWVFIAAAHVSVQVFLGMQAEAREALRLAARLFLPSVGVLLPTLFFSVAGALVILLPGAAASVFGLAVFMVLLVERPPYSELLARAWALVTNHVVPLLIIGFVLWLALIALGGPLFDLVRAIAPPGLFRSLLTGSLAAGLITGLAVLAASVYAELRRLDAPD